MVRFGLASDHHSIFALSLNAILLASLMFRKPCTFLSFQRKGTGNDQNGRVYKGLATGSSGVRKPLSPWESNAF